MKSLSELFQFNINLMINLDQGIKQGNELIDRGSREKNWLVIALGVLNVIFLIFIIVGTFFLNNIKKGKETTLQPVTTSGTPQLNRREITEKVLTWLGEQKDEKGVYYFTTECSSLNQPEKCQHISDSRSGISVIWAKFQALKNGLEIGKENLLADIETYANKDKIPFLQNDFWNCKLMYELWLSDLFDQETKNKIEQICWRGSYYHPPDLIKRIKGKEVSGAIKDINFDLVGKGQYVFETEINEGDKTKEREYSVYPSDFVARYLWQKDINQLKKAKFYFDKAVQLYLSSPSSFDNSCLLGISAIDLFKINHDEGYLSFAKTLFNRIQDEQVDSRRSIYCLYFAEELSESTQEEKYKSWETKKLSEFFLSNFEKISGEKGGAFRFLENGQKNFPIVENSLLVGLLIN